ncbi:aminotransferase class III-fold pyridoxal phosphate-dependent enzyme [Streptomyces sp. NPDC046870]|uniref:aminotransferase class III-fold pyridoxal phosphate-dependent enzyme n=1 Tax=Streptomyces sp. NPDC046870 TaxID=3155135 RepID=UPI0034541F1D
MPVPAPPLDTSAVDLTTTSVGRDTLPRTYTSFFANVRFSGTFRVIATVDPAYGVPPEERAATLAFLRDLPRSEPRVSEVVVEEFPRPVGLPGALSVLLAHARTPVGVHLEDDWEFDGPVDLDALIEDLLAGGGTQIVLGNSHVARGGTFDRPEEARPVAGTRVPLVRLTPASWAAGFLPLSPHVHVTDRWAPAVARALATTDPGSCVDERLRDLVIAENGYEEHRVLWTRDVVAHDIGRPWLAERSRFRAITPEHLGTGADTGALPEPGDRPLTLARSAALRERAERVIPGTSSTLADGPGRLTGIHPGYLERGDGALVRDVDGRSYVDFVCAGGAATLGHNHPVVANTVRERGGRGLLLSLPVEAEITAAEALVAAVPGVEMVRFLKTRTGARAAAVRLARTVTGRDRVLFAGRPAGPPGASPAVELDSADDDALLLRLLADEGSRTAAVVLCPPHHRRLTAGFLAELRRLCDLHGTMLVLDEDITAFRLAPGGLGQSLATEADLTCFSTSLAAGAALAAVAGPRRTMAHFAKLGVASAFTGERVSLEVMKAALRHYANTDYYARVAMLGRRLRDGLDALAGCHGLAPFAVGHDAMPCLRFAADPAGHAPLAEAFVAGMARRGVLLGHGVNFVSAAHGEAHIDFALDAAEDLLAAPGLTGRLRSAHPEAAR